MLEKGINYKKKSNNGRKDIIQKEFMLEVINHAEVSEALNEFVLQENQEKGIPNVSLSFIEGDYRKTKYNSKHSIANFFNKTHKFEELKRKGNVKEDTPSLAYIAACKKENLVPIASFLVKREGNESELNLKYIIDYEAIAISVIIMQKPLVVV